MSANLAIHGRGVPYKIVVKIFSTKEGVMCETNAYVATEGGEELYLDNVDIVRPEDGRVYLRNLFGQEKTFEGGIKEMRLSKHRIVLESRK